MEYTIAAKESHFVTKVYAAIWIVVNPIPISFYTEVIHLVKMCLTINYRRLLTMGLR